uniref:Micro-fibrillar-associated protein 1 C-terminal domain-containing protein n=1 Tax=Strigamia maritima TaxID=126957 RepID=T1J742_STRMM
MATTVIPIQSTAGAIPVLNEKGEVSMRKVKVHRYVSGKRPEYAPHSSSGEDSDDEFPFEKKNKQNQELIEIATIEQDERDDPRLRRLQNRDYETNTEERVERHRHIHAPEVLITGEEELKEQEKKRKREEEVESSEEEDLDDDEIEKRRLLLRKKQLDAREVELEILDVEEEEKPEPETEESASEYEEYTESEEEIGPRLKPVFVKKRDRITVQERERIELQQQELEVEAKKMAEDRRRDTLKIIEEENKKDLIEKEGLTDPSNAVDSGDENDEAEYESWKLRELKRVKRDRDDRESREKERLEIERYHSLTDEERRAEQRLNPKLVTNKSVKGKYKFLQKYYHRGAFFMDEDDEVFQRDFSQPTLEDHFDKTILPKVMQVKNFGRSGRTKYTHLVDQDTTQFDSPWVQETAQNLKFHANQSGGMKQTFDRPTYVLILRDAPHGLDIVSSSKAVQIDVYYESLCPDSVKFITKQLWPAYQKLSSIISLQLVPYGKASYHRNGDDWIFTCQHGPEECKGNIVQACAIHLHPQTDKNLQFVNCAMSSKYPPNAGQSCAESSELNWSQISDCIDSTEGKDVLHEMGVKTENLQPRLTFVPWIVVNGKTSPEILDAALTDLQGLICKSYAGPEVPPPCT